MTESRESQSLKAGFALAKAITRRHSKTFYFASHFLPKAKRQAAYAVYAACRASDDAVDEVSAQQEQSLSRVREDINAVYSAAPLADGLFLALRKTVKDYGIPREHFDVLIDGMRTDLFKKRYKNFAELYDYSYKAAGVIGLMMLKILGLDSGQARDYGVSLGIAMQLTNITRDIKEDYARGRVYLPEDEIKRFTVAETDFAGERINENMKNLLKIQVSRARQYYGRSEAGIKIIHDPRCRLVVRTMKEMYEAILNEIEKNDYNVLSKHVYVNSLKKLGIILRILFYRGPR